ncbi:hypothetical protein EYF80_062759 [Liparis tanakae]|uniref:Uncharacterized protein n=1 Tax=Liparis tanakae TaxID=230148 RepID=A0A4Z2EE15_9TELE|nr:hypothetical protein EYF80_062759 [Liparis tanakae]
MSPCIVGKEKPLISITGRKNKTAVLRRPRSNKKIKSSEVTRRQPGSKVTRRHPGVKGHSAVPQSSSFFFTTFSWSRPRRLRMKPMKPAS